MRQETIAKTRYNKDYWLVWKTGFNDGFKKLKEELFEENDFKNDIQVILEDNEGNVLDDAICHYGSYGVKDGLWEIMSKSLPKNHGESVMGHLTWKEVEKYFDKTIKKRALNSNTQTHI